MHCTAAVEKAAHGVLTAQQHSKSSPQQHSRNTQGAPAPLAPTCALDQLDLFEQWTGWWGRGGMILSLESPTQDCDKSVFKLLYRAPHHPGGDWSMGCENRKV